MVEGDALGEEAGPDVGAEVGIGVAEVAAGGIEVTVTGRHCE